jgi:hypothetical protein
MEPLTREVTRYSSNLHARQQGQAVMLMIVGIVFLVGTLVFLASISHSYYLTHIAQGSTHSNAMTVADSAADSDATSGSLSEPGILTRYWLNASHQISLAFLSGIGLRTGSFSAMWLAAVGAAAIAMYCTRPA